MKGKIDYLLSQFHSWKTSRKIVVIESDDWGSERVPDISVREALIAFGVNMEINPHAKYDTLERFEDLELLEKTLKDLNERYNKKVKITANFIAGNPDFSKIREANFTSFFYEPFTETYRNRDGNEKVINKIHQLISRGYMQPQFHGREHINAHFWLEELRNANKHFLAAFKLNCYAIDAPSSRKTNNLMTALDYVNEEQLRFIKSSITDGHKIFQKSFGFSSKTFIAPRYVWSEDLNDTFILENIKCLQSSLYQFSSSGNDKNKIFHYTGQKNKKHDLTYIVRNVFFEPAYGNMDWVCSALKKVELAFKFKTPAIISMHRINFVGGLNPFQSEKNLIQFKRLFENIIERHPNVEFLSSDELARLI